MRKIAVSAIGLGLFVSLSAHAACPLPNTGQTVVYDEGVIASFEQTPNGAILQTNDHRKKNGVTTRSTYSWLGLPVFMDGYVATDARNDQIYRRQSHEYKQIDGPEVKQEKAFAACDVAPGTKLNYVHEYKRELHYLDKGEVKTDLFQDYSTIYRLNDSVQMIEDKLHDSVVLVKDITRRHMETGKVNTIKVTYYISRKIGVYVRREFEKDGKRYPDRVMVRYDAGL